MSEPETPSTSPRASGCLLAASCLIGTVIGLRAHQPSLGIVLGFGVGVLISLIMWLKERRS